MLREVSLESSRMAARGRHKGAKVCRTGGGGRGAGRRRGRVPWGLVVREGRGLVKKASSLSILIIIIIIILVMFYVCLFCANGSRDVVGARSLGVGAAVWCKLTLRKADVPAGMVSRKPPRMRWRGRGGAARRRGGTIDVPLRRNSPITTTP